MARGLYERNWSFEDIRQLFRLIDWIMDLPDELEEAFRRDLHRYEEEKRMRYVTSIERLAIKESREQGLRTTIRLACVALEGKFGQRARKLFPRIEKLDDFDALIKLGDVIRTAKTLVEVRKHLEKTTKE